MKNLAKPKNNYSACVLNDVRSMVTANSLLITEKSARYHEKWLKIKFHENFPLTNDKIHQGRPNETADNFVGMGSASKLSWALQIKDDIRDSLYKYIITIGALSFPQQLLTRR
jgi:hypothetical protein